MKRFLFYTILSLTLLSACNKDPFDSSKLSASPSVSEVNALPQIICISINSNKKWNARNGSAKWASICETSKSRGYICVSMELNSAETERRDTIFLTSGKYEARAVIVQKGLGSVIEPLHPTISGVKAVNVRLLSEETGSAELSFPEGTARWLTLAPTPGEMDENLFTLVPLEPNTGTENRTATLTFTVENARLSTTVTQISQMESLLANEVPGIYNSNGEQVLAPKRGEMQLSMRRNRNIASSRSLEFHFMNTASGEYFSIEGMPYPCNIGDSFEATIGGNMTGLPHTPGSKVELNVIDACDGRIWLYCPDGTGYIIKRLQ